ncbi:hypothetical protein QJS66_02180 [Kocuria rhizophila]|nr:hypothetical protein QJS66_02180 [Kocuria rhizophila]
MDFRLPPRGSYAVGTAFMHRRSPPVRAQGSSRGPRARRRLVLAGGVRSCRGCRGGLRPRGGVHVVQVFVAGRGRGGRCRVRPPTVRRRQSGAAQLELDQRVLPPSRAEPSKFGIYFRPSPPTRSCTRAC